MMLLLGALVSPVSHACRVPPRQQLVTPDEQIAMATDISLAKVVSVNPSATLAGGWRPSVDYAFQVQERLLGPNEQRFVLVGAQGETRPPPSSSDHSDEAFWQRGGGRLYNDPDCMLRPGFILGEYYLVFRGPNATWRSFEHIRTVDGQPDAGDKWLSYVKAKLEGRPQRPPGAVTLPVQPANRIGHRN